MIPTSDFSKYFEKNKNITGIFLTQTENIFWLTGFLGSFAWVVIFPNNQIKLITDGRYAQKAQKIAAQNKNLEFCLYDKDFSKNIKNVFEKNLGDDFSLDKNSKINFEVEDCISFATQEKIKNIFPSLNFLPQKSLITQRRKIKNASEIEYSQIAQNRVDKILTPLMKAQAKEGVSEKELAFQIEIAIRSGGDFGISFEPIVAFGKNSALPHHHPSSQKLKRNENILVDCGAQYKGYASDMTRNFFLGVPSQAYQKKFDLCLAAQQETLKKYKKGVSVSTLENFCRKKLGSEEKYFIHSLGHGVGLEIHEDPTVSSRSSEILEKNNIVTCEPGIYYPEKFGIRIEDILVIGDSEPIVFSQTEKELILL